MASGPPIQLTAQVRTDAVDPADPAQVVILKGPLPPPAAATNSTITSVPASAVPVLLLAANPARLGFSIRNNSTTDELFVKASAVGPPVSSSFHTVAICPGGYYEDPYRYVGEVTGVWSGATGNALIDEYT